MKFIDYSKEVYFLLKNKDFSQFSITDENDFLSVMFSLKKDISLKEYQKLYRAEIEKIIDRDLPIYESEEVLKMDLKKNYYYDETTPKYATLYLFWIWQNKISFSNDALEEIVKAIFMGTMGHRFIDMYADDEKQSKEWMFLGNYLIRSFENTFINILGFENSYEVINKYRLRFLKVEYLEKKNLWNTCPFTWENIEDLSYKSAPLLAIFEALFSFSGFSHNKIDDLIQAFIDVLVVNQIMDDLTDAKDDLQKGRETLVMSGFYEHHGSNADITQKMIDNYLSQEKLYAAYKTMRILLDKAVSIFELYQDEIFLIFTQFFRLKFHKQFEIQNNLD